MEKKGSSQKDETLTHVAVKAYRDQFKFCPNQGTRKDIVATVTDLELWQEVLTSWGYWKEGKWIKFNPLSVRKMLSEYERRAKHSQRSNAAPRDANQPRGNEKDLHARLSQRRDVDVLRVPEDTRSDLRRSNRSLDEIMAQVLPKM